MHCAPTTGGFLSGCHRPSIMARRSSPLLLALGDGSPDSVNSPMILASSALACWSWKTMLSTNHSGHHRDLHLVTVNLASLVKPVSDYWLFILKPVIGISKIQSPMVRGCLSIVKDSHSCERLGECRLYKKCAFFFSVPSSRGLETSTNHIESCPRPYVSFDSWLPQTRSACWGTLETSLRWEEKSIQ